jgi:hypothetical protein
MALKILSPSRDHRRDLRTPVPCAAAEAIKLATEEITNPL